MADDPSNTKPELCSLDAANWVSATELGGNITQINHGAWVLAYVDIQAALAGGCGAVLELEQNGQKSYSIPPPGFWIPPDRLRWVNGLNPSMRREDYPDRPWQWELRAYLSPSEPWEFCHIEGFPLAREQVSTTLRVFLRRAEAVQWGLLPALESPQAVAIEERPPPPKQPGVPTVGSTGGETAPILAPAADASVPTANTEAPVNRGGRPTDRDMVLQEAERRLKRPQQVPKTLRAFSCELHEWLKDHGEHHVAKTGGVMKADTIEGHVRLLWNAYKARR